MASGTTSVEHAADAAAHGAEASGAGMPQLDFSTFPNQIFWLLVTLVVIYFALSRIAIPRISAVLAERAGTITNDIAAAEELKQKAEAAEAAYQKALVDARAEASRIVAEAKAEIQAWEERMGVVSDERYTGVKSGWQGRLNPLPKSVEQLSMQDINRYQFRRNRSDEPGLPAVKPGSDAVKTTGGVK